MTTCFSFQSLFCTRTQFKGSCNACICKHAALAATRSADESQGGAQGHFSLRVSRPGDGGAPPGSGGRAESGPRQPRGWVTMRGPQKSRHVQKNGVLEKGGKKKSQQKMCVTADYFRPWSMHNANKQLPGYMPVKTIQSHSAWLQELSKQVVKS